MRYLILLLLALFTPGCLYETTYIEDEDMAKRYPPANHDVRQIPVVAPLVPRSGPWSGDNQLGYIARYAPNQRGTQTILKLDEWGPPDIWTVSLFLKSEYAEFNGFDIKARINFGAGGATQVYECDWLQGTQISLPMNAVNVEAVFDGIDPVSEGAGLSLGVQLARGTRSGDEPPILTMPTLSLPTLASSSRIEVPSFAKKAVIVSADSGGTGSAIPASFFSTDMRLIGLSGNALGIATARSNGSRAIGERIEIPIIGLTRFVQVVNATGDTNDAHLFFELDG